MRCNGLGKLGIIKPSLVMQDLIKVVSGYIVHSELRNKKKIQPTEIDIFGNSGNPAKNIT